MSREYRKFEMELAGRKLVVETGKIAPLANGACIVRYGETVVSAAVTASLMPREGVDFFPLSVDFEEKLYSVGKIPGSFSKREGKPSDKAILTSRLIDRPIRPLFPASMRNDVSVVCSVLSVDADCSAEITAMIATSVALSVSDIPWNGPIGGVCVGLVENKIVINPDEKQRAKSKLFLTVASTGEKILMIEAGADRISDSDMYSAILKGHEVNLSIVEFIKNIQKEVGKPKFQYTEESLDKETFDRIAEYAENLVQSSLNIKDKIERDKRISEILTDIYEHFQEDDEIDTKKIDECVYKIEKKIVRNWILNEQRRVDGRSFDEIRPLAAEVGLLPRTHGSSLFSRGYTQVLTSVTLGPLSDKQTLDGIDGESSKRYLHHYNFPSYSVGETKPSRGPGRREIGHGALAEKALLPVIPSEHDFPYTIRTVSEVLSSNGSTSQGSVCASTLALMDAGVPILEPVAGISCGLVKEEDRWVTFVDIQGIEDFFGDMDFKVAGTHAGITAIQMDIKIDGLEPEIVKEALEKTHKARNFILDEVMLKCIPNPRRELSKYAPKVLVTFVPVDKIGDVIGSGGKIVQKICKDYDVNVDIEEDGKVLVLGTDSEKCKKALEFIENLVKELEVGKSYKGKVVRIMDFGAFIEILPGKEGLCHISQLSNRRVEKVTDVLNLGQDVEVKVTEIDSRGRINLTLINKYESSYKK